MEIDYQFWDLVLRAVLSIGLGVVCLAMVTFLFAVILDMREH